MLLRFASFSHRHRRLVVVMWVVVVVAGFGSAPALFERLSSDGTGLDDTESERAAEMVRRVSPGGDELYAVADGLPATDAGLRGAVTATAERIEAVPGVTAVRTPWSQGRGAADPRAVATDGRAVAVLVELAPSAAGEDAVEPVAELLQGIDAPRVVVGGEPLLDEEMESQAAADLARAELLSMPVVLLLLLVVFGGLVAAGLPLVIAAVGVAGTMGALVAVSTVLDVAVYAVNIVTMLGLGLAVDYALLVVARFREERAADAGVEGALLRTFATAGRTVAFSGLTVAASLAGLLVFPDDFLRSMGFAGLAVVLIDLLAAMTLLPALLSMFGHRIKPRTGAGTGAPLLARVAGAVRGHRVVVVAVCGTLLALAAVPFLDARFADPDARSLPESSPNRALTDLVAERFETVSDVDPITAVMSGRAGGGPLAAYVDDLSALDGVRAVSVRDDVPGLTVVDVLPEGASQGSVAMRLVDEVRATDAPLPVQVAGDAAELADYQAALVQRLPWALAVVVLATFALLFLFTGSLVIPVKAIAMNVLSLGASFGALVWVFQEGHLGALVGTEALGSLAITTPVLVFAIAFGLSMDYEVFLLGRITEWWRRTGDNDTAVLEGLRGTAGTISAAALLMVVVFAGFVAGGFSPVKQVGLGLVLTIAIDATVVRMLLVPALMSLLGRGNWWAPPLLRRVHDRFGLTEAYEPAARGLAGRAVHDAQPATAPV